MKKELWGFSRQNRLLFHFVPTEIGLPILTLTRRLTKKLGGNFGTEGATDFGKIK
jgi:hypothetical protein